MPEYVRLATFEANQTALESVVNQIKETGPLEGLPARTILALADRGAGKAVFIVRFDSEEDLHKGNEMLDAWDPPQGMKRLSVNSFEVLLEHHER
jgi:hypothetical protein